MTKIKNFKFKELFDKIAEDLRGSCQDELDEKNEEVFHEDVAPELSHQWDDLGLEDILSNNIELEIDFEIQEKLEIISDMIYDEIIAARR